MARKTRFMQWIDQQIAEAKLEQRSGTLRFPRPIEEERAEEYVHETRV